MISGYGFNGSSPDQGTILIGLKPLSERPGSANSSFAIADRLNAKLSALSSGLAVVGQPPAVPGFSAQGGFYFQFNDLTGNYSFNQLDEQAQRLIKAGKASGDFSNLYTQFIPSAPAFGLTVDRAVMGALNVDYDEARAPSPSWPVAPIRASPTKTAKCAMSTCRPAKTNGKRLKTSSATTSETAMAI